MKKLILLTAMLLTMTVGLAKDIKTLVVTTTPPMHCESCENKIKGNLRFEKGVKKIETSIPNMSTLSSTLFGLILPLSLFCL